MRVWLSQHFVLLSIVSIATFAAGIVGAVIVAVLLPEDYFTRPPGHAHGVSLARKIMKNIAGSLRYSLHYSYDHLGLFAADCMTRDPIDSTSNASACAWQLNPLGLQSCVQVSG
jgi:hypothetical protein